MALEERINILHQRFVTCFPQDLGDSQPSISINRKSVQEVMEDDVRRSTVQLPESNNFQVSEQITAVFVTCNCIVCVSYDFIEKIIVCFIVN